MIKNTLTKRQGKGFALIATLSIMMLLMIMAMTMMSLSSSEVRSSANNKEMVEAQANARMALMFAIGELQMYTGKDTRITAPADIVQSGAPPLTGVWKSWEGTNHDSDGRPIKPDYTVKTKSESTRGHFLTWLVSGAQPGQEPLSPAPTALVSPVATGDTIPLLSSGTLGTREDAAGNVVDNPGQVHVTPQLVNGESGAIGWWVSPENQKARIMQPYRPQSDDASSLVQQWQSHTVPNLEAFGLSSLQNNPENFNHDANNPSSARRVISLGTSEFIADDDTSFPQHSFHDLSPTAVGLLTNSATGGWRKDLSILSEKWEEIYTAYPTGKLPLFRITPHAGGTSLVERPSATSANHTPDQSTLYPWSSYSSFSPKKWPNTWYAASSSWESLVKFATLYKNFTYSSGVAESPFIWAPVMKWRWRGSDRDATPREFYDYNHTPRLHPIIARFQFIIYVRARPDTSRPGRYMTELIYSPIVTLWNPYNVRLSIDNPGAPNSGVVIGGKRSFPGAFTAQPIQWFADPDNIPLNRFSMLSNGNFQYMDTNGNFHNEYDNHLKENTDVYNPGATRMNTLIDLRTWGVNLPAGELVFEPGEVRMFTPDGIAERRFGTTGFRTKAGYQPAAPSGLPITVRGGNLGLTDFFWYVLKNEAYTQPYKFRSPGRGFNVSFGMSTGASYSGGSLYPGVNEEMASMTALTNGNRAKVYWPDGDFEPHGYTVEEILSVPAMPLYSITMGPRLTAGMGSGTPQSRPTKGFLQNDPLAGMSLVDPGIDNQNSHPANGNFEIIYNTLSFGSSLTPNLSDREGFIVTGFQSGDGLSRLITHELPLRPMASILELQAWNPRGKNPMPPFQSHLIGNSDATPMIPSDDIVPSTMTPNNPAENLQHDDAYCANHLLFDDFFMSSIAPQPSDFGNSISKNIETVYGEFLKGITPLTNRAYRPIINDLGLSDTEVTARVNEMIASPDGDGWQKVASRLEVDGMFNVNSTSVEAWKALLGHAKSMGEIAYYDGQNAIGELADNNDRPHPITRSPLAPDIEAGSDATAGDPVKNSEVTGFRRLTDEQIADLANKVVEQVRLRGPFLSLSEFVNRQLSENNNLAIAGAIQGAINNLEEANDPMSVLRDPDNGLSDETMASKAGNGNRADKDRLAGVGSEFEEAAIGSSTYGLPGWLRQAEILRPIAPVLSARDDTFTIRAYGDARDTAGNIIARAWCEATVRRQRDFVDPARDQADSVEPPEDNLTMDKNMNVIYGRRYNIVAFRWLQMDEV